MSSACGTISPVAPSCNQGFDPPPIVPPGEPEAILVADFRAPADASAISVREAIEAHVGEDAVFVRGALFIDDTNGTAWLCDDFIPPGSGAHQPSCARPALLLRHPDAAGRRPAEVIVELVDAAQLGGLQNVDGVRWAEDATLYGTVMNPRAEDL